MYCEFVFLPLIARSLDLKVSIAWFFVEKKFKVTSRFCLLFCVYYLPAKFTIVLLNIRSVLPYILFIFLIQAVIVDESLCIFGRIFLTFL